MLCKFKYSAYKLCRNCITIYIKVPLLLRTMCKSLKRAQDAEIVNFIKAMFLLNTRLFQKLFQNYEMKYVSLLFPASAYCSHLFDTSSIKAHFHYERGKEHSLFLLLIFN